jgi:AcrR family transcriptional regulator
MSQDKTTTRGRILDACRALFNERGPNEVTTAEIAQTVCISEGNLHYHFRRKEQILVALFDEYEAALIDVATREKPARGDGVPPRYYLSLWFNLMWEWRLFYSAGVYRLAPALQPRLKTISDTGQAHVRVLIASLVREGKLDAGPAEIDQLVVNAWIVASYWIDYLRTRQGVSLVTRDHLSWGLSQVDALFGPYVVRHELRERSGRSVA